jgi:hypothetical protein
MRGSHEYIRKSCLKMFLTGAVAQAYNLSTWECRGRRIWSMKPAWST